MEGAAFLVVVLEFVGVLAFALDGGLTAVRDRRLDVVGVVTLALITATGGGMIRDVLLGATPAAALVDWRYLVVSAIGGGLAFAAGRYLDKVGRLLIVADALGLCLFAVTGTVKAEAYGLTPLAAVLLGTISAVGGGMVRDLCLGRVPMVLSRDTQLYAVPAILAAAMVALTHVQGWASPWWLVTAAVCAFALRMASVRWNITAPARS